MIIVKNRELLIPNNERYIGTTYDNDTENRVFQVPRFSQRGVDLAALTFRLDIQYANESYDTVILDKEVGEAFIILIWKITSATLQVPGTLYIGIRAVDSEATVKWSSFSAAMYAERHLNTPGNYTGDLTEIEQMEQDHQYMKGVVDELKANIDYAHDAEAWAKGTRSGSAVPSTDPTYHNNSKYYSEQANTKATQAANSATAAANSATQAAETVADTNTRFNNAVASVTSDTEVIDARVGADGTVYPVLKNRLDAEHTDVKNAISKDVISFSAADFENGTITNTGAEQIANYRVRSKKYFYAPVDTWIINTSSAFYYNAVFYNANKVFQSASKVTAKNLFIPAGTYYRIVVQRAIAEDTSETATPATWIAGLSYTTEKYVLNNPILELEKSVNGIDDKTLSVDDVGFPGAYINTSGVYTYNRNTSIYIGEYHLIPYGAYKVDVTAGGLNNTISVIAFYDVTLNYISGNVGITGATEYSNISIPDNAAYYILSGFNTPDLSAKFYLYSRLDSIEKRLDDAPDITEQYRYNDIFEDKTVYPSTNINPSNGKAVENASFAATGFIAVEPETTYRVFRDDKKYHQVGNMAFYNAGKSYLSGQQSSYAQFTTPENCYFVRFCVLYAGIYTASNFTFANMHITKGVLGAIEPIPYVPAFRTFGNLYGKKWVGLGDSLTEVNDRAELHYHDYICAEEGMTFANFAVGGSGYMNRQNVNKAFYQLASGIDTDGDIVTIMGGVNDCLFAGEIGTATDSGTTTVCGCINATIDAIEAKYPLHAPLGIISPLPCDWIDSGNESNYDTQLPSDPTCRMSVLVERLAEICRLRGYPFLDLFHSSGIKPNLADVREKYFSCGSTLTGDGLHPNSEGQKLFYPRIMEFLKGICR